MFIHILFIGHNIFNNLILQKHPDADTVESWYLELENLEFCETGSVYLSQKYILIAFSNHNLVLETFLHVQITEVGNLNL